MTRGDDPLAVPTPTLIQRAANWVVRKGAPGLRDEAILRASGLGGEGVIATALRSDHADDTPKSAKQLLEFYGKSPALYMVLRKVGHLIAGQTWRVYRVKGAGAKRETAFRILRSGDERARRATMRSLVSRATQDAAGVELTELPDHPLLQLLNSAPQGTLGIQLRSLCQVYLDLVGEVFLLYERNGMGMPIRWGPIKPTDIERLPTVDQPFYWVETPRGRVDIPISEVFAIRDPDPTKPYGRGIGSGRVLGDEIETHEYSAKYLKNFFRNGARPDFLITAPDMTPQQADRARSSWLDKLRGFGKAHLPHFMKLPPEGKIQELDGGWKHGGVVELKEHERAFIMQVIGVSPEIFGMLESSNRATITEARAILAENVLIPRLEVWREAYQTQVVPMFDDGIVIEYDDPRPDDREMGIKAAGQAPWCMTVDEHRKLVGLGPDGDVEAGKLRPIPSGWSFREELEGEAVALPAAGGEVPGASEGDDSEMPGEGGDGDEMPMEEPKKAARTVQRDLSPDQVETLVDREVERLAPGLARAFGMSLEEFRQSVEFEALVQLIRQQRAGDQERVLQIAAFLSAFLSMSMSTLSSAVSSVANRMRRLLAREYGLTPRVEIINSYAMGEIQSRATRMVRDVGEQTKLGIRQLLEEAFASDMAPEVLAKRLIREIGLTPRMAMALQRREAKWVEAGKTPMQIDRLRAAGARRMLKQRARAIATTELRVAVNVGQHLALTLAAERNELPMNLKREWGGSCACPICSAICGQRRGVNESFYSHHDGSSHRHPPAHPFCACSISLVLAEQ